MNAYKKYKNSLERFLQTERGKRSINFAYSFGAAIVILGAMFKLLHFPFGNEMLFIGMVTECIVFIVSAFDTPIRDYNWEQVFPALSGNSGNGEQPGAEIHSGLLQQITAHRETTSSSTGQRVSSVNPEATALSPLHSPVSSGEAENEIVLSLSTQTEEYGKQMENLNRTLSGLNSIYEIQLKSISSQIGTIEQINQGLIRLRNMYGDNLPDGSVIKTETEKMADQLKELNNVYARMLSAMTVNKYDNPANPNA